MKNSQDRKKGFTLIELLVVITIIGILAGIAISSFGGIFGAAGQLAAEDSSKPSTRALVQKYKGQVKFPKGDALDEESPAGFAVWFRSKPVILNLDYGTSMRMIRLWLLLKTRTVPDFLLNTTDVGDLDDDQKQAIGMVNCSSWR